MEIIHLENVNQFKELIVSEEKILVDFYATWCGPCKMLSPIIDEVAEENKEYKFYKIDVDENEEFDKQFGIMAMPTLLVFEDGKLTKRQTGFISKEELEEFLK
jgi:thioredoxin 1